MTGSARFTLERVSQPDIEPVTLAEMKRHLHEFATITSRDDDITAMIVAAREWAEDFTGRALVDQTWRLTLHGRRGSFAGGDIVGGTKDGALPVGYGFYHGLWSWGHHGEIMLRKAPVLEITKFVSVDLAGVETAVDPTTYELREKSSKWPRLVALNGATWSTWLTGDLRIEYRAGFADRMGSPQQDASVVPNRFKTAMKLYCSGLYDEDVAMLPLLLKTAEGIIKPERSDLSLA